MIVHVTISIWSFLVVIFLLIVGFAVIFYQYTEDTNYLNQLLFLHNMVYGDFDIEHFGPVQMVFFAIIALITCVVLLNLLISIMGDTYSRVLENKVPSDGLEKIEIILEVVQVNRNLRYILYILFYCSKRKRREFIVQRNRKGYLLIAAQSNEFNDDDDDDSKEIEGRLRSLKQSMKTNLTQLKEENNLLRQDLHKVKTELQESMIRVNDNMEKQIRMSAQIQDSLRKHTVRLQSQITVQDRGSFSPQPNRQSYPRPMNNNDGKGSEKDQPAKFKYIIPAERDDDSRRATVTNFRTRLIIKPQDDKPFFDTMSGETSSAENTRKAQNISFGTQNFTNPILVADQRGRGISPQLVHENSLDSVNNSIDMNSVMSRKDSEVHFTSGPKKKDDHQPSLFSKFKIF